MFPQAWGCILLLQKRAWPVLNLRGIGRQNFFPSAGEQVASCDASTWGEVACEPKFSQF